MGLRVAVTLFWRSSSCHRQRLSGAITNVFFPVDQDGVVFQDVEGAGNVCPIGILAPGLAKRSSLGSIPGRFIPDFA